MVPFDKLPVELAATRRPDRFVLTHLTVTTRFIRGEVKMESKMRAIVINEKDNVATALGPLRAGTSVSVEIKGLVQKINLRSDIPMGHKFALKDMEEGEAVIKYGEPIGQSKVRIIQGEHIHVYNVVSQPRGGSR
jgi:altronate dehydratase small subunit